MGDSTTMSEPPRDPTCDYAQTALMAHVRNLALDVEFGVPGAIPALLNEAAVPALTAAVSRGASNGATKAFEGATRRDALELFAILLSLLVRRVAAVTATAAAVDHVDSEDLISVATVAMAQYDCEHRGAAAAAASDTRDHETQATVRELLQSIVHPMYIPSMQLVAGDTGDASSAGTRLLRASAVATMWGVVGRDIAAPTTAASSSAAWDSPVLSAGDILLVLIRHVLSLAELLLCGDPSLDSAAPGATALPQPPSASAPTEQHIFPTDVLVFLAYAATLPTAPIPGAGNSTPTASGRVSSRAHGSEEQRPLKLCSPRLLCFLRRAAEPHSALVAACASRTATARVLSSAQHPTGGDAGLKFEWAPATVGALIAAVGVYRIVGGNLHLSPNPVAVSHSNAATALFVSCVVRHVADAAVLSSAVEAGLIGGAGSTGNGTNNADEWSERGAQPPISLSLSDVIRAHAESVFLRCQQSVAYDDTIDDPSSTVTTAAAGDVLHAILSGCLVGADPVPTLSLHVAATVMGYHAQAIARPHAWRHDYFHVFGAIGGGQGGSCPPPSIIDEVLTLACRIIDATALVPLNVADAPRFGMEGNDSSSGVGANEAASPLRLGLHTQVPMAKEARRRPTDGWDDDEFEDDETNGAFGSPDLGSNTVAFSGRETLQQRSAASPNASFIPSVSDDVIGLLLPDSLVATTEAIFPRLHPEQIELAVAATLNGILPSDVTLSAVAVADAVNVLLAALSPSDPTTPPTDSSLNVHTSELLNAVVTVRGGNHAADAHDDSVCALQQVESVRLQQIALRVALAIAQWAPAASPLPSPAGIAKIVFAVDDEKPPSGFYYGHHVQQQHQELQRQHPVREETDNVAVVALPVDPAAAVASQRVFQFVMGLQGRAWPSDHRAKDDDEGEDGDGDGWGDDDDDSASNGDDQDSAQHATVWWRPLTWDVNRSEYPLLANAIAADSGVRNLILQPSATGEDTPHALSKVAGLLITRHAYHLLLSKRRVGCADAATRAASSYLAALAAELMALCEAVMLESRSGTASVFVGMPPRMSEQQLDTALAAWAVAALVDPLIQLAIAAGTRRGGASGRSLSARRSEGAAALDALIVQTLVADQLRPIIVRGIPARLSYGVGVASLLSADAASWLEAQARVEMAGSTSSAAAIADFPLWYTRCAFDDHEDLVRAAEAESEGSGRSGSNPSSDDDNGSGTDADGELGGRAPAAAVAATIPAVRSWVCGLLRLEGYSIPDTSAACPSPHGTAQQSAATSPVLAAPSAAARQEQAALLRAERAERDVLTAEFFHRVDASSLGRIGAAAVASHSALRVDCWAAAALIAHRAAIHEAMHGAPQHPNNSRTARPPVLAADRLLPLLAEVAATRYAIIAEADTAKAPLVARAEALMGAAWVMAEERAVRVEAVETEEVEARMALEEMCAGYVAGGPRGLAVVAREEVARAARNREAAANSSMMHDWARGAHALLRAQAAAIITVEVYRGFDWQEKMARSIEATAEAHEWAELLEDAEVEARRAATRKAVAKAPLAAPAPAATAAQTTASVAPVRPQLAPPPAGASSAKPAAAPSGWDWDEDEEEEEEEDTGSDGDEAPTPAVSAAARPATAAPLSSTTPAKTAGGQVGATAPVSATTVAAAPDTNVPGAKATGTATKGSTNAGWEWDSDEDAEEEEEDVTSDEDEPAVVVAPPPVPPPPPPRSAPAFPAVTPAVPSHVPTAAGPPPVAARPMVRTAPVRPPPVALAMHHSQAATTTDGRHTTGPSPPPTPQLPVGAATAATPRPVAQPPPNVPAVPVIPRVPAVPTAPPVAVPATPAKVLTSAALLRKAADLTEEETDARDEFESEENYALQRLRATADAERARLRRRVA